MEYGTHTNAGIAPQVPPVSGIASRIADLQKAAQEIVQLAYSAKSALGISSPPADAKSGQPSSLADALTDLRVQINRASHDLEEVIQHLNS